MDTGWTWTKSLLFAALFGVTSSACDLKDLDNSATHQGSTGNLPATGGNSGTGSTSATGGDAGSGSNTQTGGTDETGGNSGCIVDCPESGGSDSTGGNSGTGSTATTGGNTATGGSVETGGTAGTGGNTSTGGNAGTGGATDCLEGNVACTNDNQCCTGICDVDTGLCAGTVFVCAELGELCAQSSDCCGFDVSCVDDTCVLDTFGTGGNVGTGGSETGGNSGTGSTATTGGNTATGGSVETGGTAGTGGNTSTGGNAGTGGSACSNQDPCGTDSDCCDAECIDGMCTAPVACAEAGDPCEELVYGGTCCNVDATCVDNACVVALACMPGLDPPQAVMTASWVEPVRDLGFDAMQMARGYDLRTIVSVYVDTVDTGYYVVATTAETGVPKAFYASPAASWAVIEDLPEALWPQTFHRIDNKICVGGRASNPNNGVANAKLFCKESGAWVEQDVGFCPTGCPSGGLIDVVVSDISSAASTTVMVVSATFSEVPPVDSYQIFMKTQGGTWKRQTLPVTTEVRLHGVWVHSDCDVYVAGQQGGSAILLHYDGSAWSVVETIPEGLVTFDAVHGNGSELYLSGGYADSRVTIMSTDLVNWHTVPVTNGGATFALLTPAFGSVMLGQSGYPSHGAIDTVNGRVLESGFVLEDDAKYIRDISMNEEFGSILIGVDGAPLGETAGAGHDVPGIYWSGYSNP